MAQKLKDKDYDALIHGHTHIPTLLQDNNKTLFCPGSTSYPRDNNGATYGLIKIYKDKIIFIHKKI